MHEPNVFAWTAIIGYYSRKGMHKECLRIYDDMQIKGVEPDRYVFPKVLRACTQALSLKDGIRVHNDVIRFGGGNIPQVCNSLIDMYSKCGDIQMARRVFDGMGPKDLLSWNSMISGYVSNGYLDLAIEFVNAMRMDGVEPDLVSWNTVIDAYCRMGKCEEASRIFGYIKEPNIISWTTLTSGYSRVGKHGIALQIFKNMMREGFVIPDADALSNILVSCRLLGAHLNGREVHGYGIKTQTLLELYNSAGAVLVTMYGEFGRVHCASNVFELMDKSDVVTWNAMILAFVHLGMVRSALTCFSQMQSIGVENDAITISTVLPACDLKFGKQIHAHVRRKDFDSAVPVWNALINMYSKSGCVEAALSVFTNMDMKDIVSWNSMIGGCGMNGNGPAALQLLHEMYHSGIQPNSVTFTSALSACAHSGLVTEGIQLFNSLTQEYGVTPTVGHYSCVVDLLGRAGWFVDAVNFIDKMPINPDKSIWGALLAACRSHQNVDINIAKLAADNLFCLEPEKAGNYVTLANIYANAGRWGDAVAVRKLMESRGLVKPSGYSWVEREY
ncbi:hypothetical protein IFM89_031912 [Coptis chinensis]|uniref:Pentatricopeptide repeat-containing protein n=1 Tax=Coptis chinensis TaxID=261450 RepID=A0A835M7F3_9MAGN|nr:hypothetical protein IFM89_031912 [Coptis chinensis]